MAPSASWGAAVRPVLRFAVAWRCFAVSGEIFGEVFTDGTITEYPGTPITDDSDHTPISWATNGSAGGQVMLTGGLDGYIFDLDTNTLVEITDMDFPSGQAAMCEFLDGYFFVLVVDSRRWQISALEDGLSWDGLDVAERSIAPDNIVTMIRRERNMAFFGNQTSEFWYNTGDALFPFAPSQGVLVEQGSAARFGCCRCDDTLIFPVQDARGTGVVSRMDGYANVRTTTYAIDRLIQGSSDLANSVAYAFQMNGHLFYVLTGEDFSDAEGAYSLVYDVVERRWYLWAQWNSTTCQWVPFIGKYHALAFGKHLIGSRTNGYLYELSQDYLDDRIVA